MKATHHNEPRARRLVRPLITLSLTLCSLAAAPALALDSGDIVIANLKGEVHFVVGGVERALRDGAVLEPPATLRTGHDGSVELHQGATTVSVAPDTVLEFPALEKRGAPIDRIVQPSGNAFYDIGKRAGRKLRVETPYLVGVVKGTQFNVAAQPSGATISLFEGLLEIRASDDSSVVDIKAGEIASRHSGDRAIGVIRMNDRTQPPTRPGATSGSGGDSGSRSPSAPASANVEGDALMAERNSADPLVNGVLETTLDANLPAALNARVEVPAGVPASGPPGTPVVETPDIPVTIVVEPPVAAGGGPVTVNPPPVVSAGGDTGSTGVVTVGGVDLGTGTDLGLGNQGSSTDTSSSSGTGNSGNGNSGNGNNGNGNAGSNSSGNGTGNSGNGDNSNQGREDDGVHGLAHKK